MAKATVYYDYHEGQLVPIWYVLNVRTLDWSKETIYVPVEAPFQLHAADDFDEEILSISVMMGDLILDSYRPQHIGIHLPPIKQRVEEANVPPQDILQFIIQVGDIEEVLMMSPFKYLYNKTSIEV